MQAIRHYVLMPKVLKLQITERLRLVRNPHNELKFYHAGKIRITAKDEMSKSQREYFRVEQMRNKELGKGSNREMEDL